MNIGWNHTKERLIAAKDHDPRPRFYHLEGTAGAVSNFFEKPQVLLDSFNNGTVVYYLAFAVLKLPALVGSGISRLIYLVKAEEIKKQDYDEAYDGWMQKDYAGKLGNKEILKAFIDTCIQNRITAEKCPYQVIVDNIGPKVNVFDLDSDGCCTRGVAEKLNTVSQNALFLFAPYVPIQIPKMELENVTERFSDYAEHCKDPVKKQAMIEHSRPVRFVWWETQDNDKIAALRQAITTRPGPD